MPRSKKTRGKKASKKTIVKSFGGGKIAGSISPMHPELEKVMEDQLKSFIDKFGREPGPDDPVVFDPDEDEPTPYPVEKMRAMTITAMIRGNAPHHLIYAYLRTGGMMLAQ